MSVPIGIAEITIILSSFSKGDDNISSWRENVSERMQAWAVTSKIVYDIGFITFPPTLANSNIIFAQIPLDRAFELVQKLKF